MKRPSIAFFYWFLLLTVLLGCSVSNMEEASKPPNIILILTDDQGYGDLSFHGNDTLSTPNLEKFKKEAIEFTRFYVSPVCAPTRASLLTGRYHLATGASWVTHREEVMRKEEVTIAEILKDNGYRTGLFGKWHNGKQYPHDPNGQGFQTFFGFTEGHLNNYFDTNLQYNQKTTSTKGYVPNLITDSAIAFIEKSTPFFCMLSFNTPHSPFQLPDAYYHKYKKMGLSDKLASVYGMVENIDDNIGRVVSALEKADKSKETIIIFMSDNGPNGYRFNSNLKGIKSHVDEGGLRVPFLIKYPALIKESGEISSMAAHIDLFPTLLDIVGVALPDSLEIHGKSLINVLKGSLADTSRFFFTHQVIRKFDTIPGAVRNHQYLLTLKPDKTELFDLIADPFQKKDILQANLSLSNSLEKKYDTWFNQVTKKGISPQKIEIGHDAAPMIEFPAPEAANLISLTFKGEEGWANDYIILNELDTEITWDLISVQPATYEVKVQMAGEAIPNSEVEITIDDQHLEIPVMSDLNKILINSPDRVARNEVYGFNWPELKLGEITVATGAHNLVLTVSNIIKAEIKSITLNKIR